MHDGVLPSNFALDDLIDAATQRGKMVPHGLVRAIERYAQSSDAKTSRQARDFLRHGSM